MNHLYFYLRVSHLDSANSGIGIETQKAVCSEWWSFQRKTGHYLDHRLGLGGVTYRATEMHDDRNDAFYIDEHVSASKTPFLKRKAGSMLWLRMVPGDVIVFPYLDRAFRNLGDFVTTVKMFQDKGIAVIFLNPPVDLSSIWGKAMASIFAVFAQIDSELKSQRSKEVWALPHVYRKRRRLGWKPVKGKPALPDIWERFIGLELIRAWRFDAPGPKPKSMFSQTKMRKLLELVQAHMENREPYKVCDGRVHWTATRICKWILKKTARRVLKLPGMFDGIDPRCVEAVEKELWRYRELTIEALSHDQIPLSMREKFAKRTTPGTA